MFETYGDVGYVLSVRVGDECDDDTGAKRVVVTRFIGSWISLNDFCFLLIDFPARCWKLSRWDLLRELEMNMMDERLHDTRREITKLKANHGR
jgi:hypothetical protein